MASDASPMDDPLAARKNTEEPIPCAPVIVIADGRDAATPDANLICTLPHVQRVEKPLGSWQSGLLVVGAHLVGLLLLDSKLNGSMSRVRTLLTWRRRALKKDD